MNTSLHACKDYLEVSSDDIIDLKILVIVTKRVEQCFCHLDPSHVTEEFNQSEKREVKIWSMGFVRVLGRVRYIKVRKKVIYRVASVTLREFRHIPT